MGMHTHLHMHTHTPAHVHLHTHTCTQAHACTVTERPRLRATSMRPSTGICRSPLPTQMHSREIDDLVPWEIEPRTHGDSEFWVPARTTGTVSVPQCTQHFPAFGCPCRVLCGLVSEQGQVSAPELSVQLSRCEQTLFTWHLLWAGGWGTTGRECGWC